MAGSRRIYILRMHPASSLLDSAVENPWECSTSCIMTVRQLNSYLDFACATGTTAFARLSAVDHEVDEFMQSTFSIYS
jgi:hypothetical protein